MARARIHGRHGRTILPTDIFVFTFLALGVAAGSSAATDNRISVVFFTIVWMTAAITRLTSLRRGDRPAVQLNCLNLRTAAILLVGSGPWVLLGFLQDAYPSSVIWQPIEVPLSLRAIGMVLAAAVIFEPFMHFVRAPAIAAQKCQSTGSVADECRLSWSVMIRSGAILLLSGSPIFALFCALWLAVTLWPHIVDVPHSLQPARAGNQLAIPVAQPTA
jgi:hypothetical protein